MIQSSIKMKFSPEKCNEAVRTLHSIIDRISAERGCMGYEIFLDSDSYVVVLEGRWRSEGDLERHLRSDEYKIILLVIEMAATPPDIRFDTVISTRGIDMIKDARIKDQE
jgi:quinol monooxygenase YgiN